MMLIMGKAEPVLKYFVLFLQQHLLRLSYVGLIAVCFINTSLADADVKRIDTGAEESPEEVLTYEEKSLYEVEERHACTYFYNERYPAFEGGLINCTWYTSKSCCKRTEVTSVFSAMEPVYSASVLCRNYINYLMCFFCSPDQYKFYINKKAMVCADYCEALFEECKSAGFNKTLIGEAYVNGTSFCAAQNFDVTDHADCFKFDPNVFGRSLKILSWSLSALLTMAGFVNVFFNC